MRLIREFPRAFVRCEGMGDKEAKYQEVSVLSIGKDLALVKPHRASFCTWIDKRKLSMEYRAGTKENDDHLETYVG